MRTFKDFVDANGENVIRSEFNSLPPGIRKKYKAKLEWKLAHLQVVRQLEMPHVRQLTGPCSGIFEIRFEIGNVQYRPLCCYGPSDGDVTILVLAKEVGSQFVPASACATALARKALLSQRGQSVDHDLN